jgi:tRNA(Ile)-lysidine synthase
MPSASQFDAKMATSWPPEAWRDVTVLLAVSGGVDSVAMLRAMVALKSGGEGRLFAAHFNHHLRSEESDADEAFVLGLCRRHGIECEVGRARPGQLAADSTDGIEAAARTARYDFLRLAAARLGARYVVTAHTADDQVETILHRIVRGTGIAGLAGIARARPLGEAAALIRPLLSFRRTELLAYLDALGQPYREDSSNADTRLTRNRIRHELLPLLAEKYNPGVVDAVLRLGSLAGEAHGVVESIVDELAERCILDSHSGGVRIDASALAGQPRYIVRELVIAAWRKQSWPMQAMGFRQWDQLAAMITTHGEDSGPTPPRQTFPGGVSAQAEPGCLRLARLDAGS